MIIKPSHFFNQNRKYVVTFSTFLPSIIVFHINHISNTDLIEELRATLGNQNLLN